MYDMQRGGQPATLTPSVLTPPLLRHRETNPSSIDTGKDTQCLVEDDSEC
jgi:hypothetical protein